MSSKNNEARLWQKVKKGLTDCFRVRPPCRASLNCTDRCHCSLNLVHWSLVSRSRPLTTGPRSSSRCSGSWDPFTAQRKLVLVSWPPIFSSLLGWWPGNQHPELSKLSKMSKMNLVSRSRLRRTSFSFNGYRIPQQRNLQLVHDGVHKLLLDRYPIMSYGQTKQRRKRWQ
jgi:hypothetical protein